MNKVRKAIKNPKLVLLYLMKYKPFRLLSDKNFISLEYYLTMGTVLNLKQPQTFNEKLQWLKLNDRNNLYTQLVDKFEVRKIIKKILGEEYLIPIYGVYDSFEQIEFKELPNQFVLKPTHTSGNYYICKDKSTINYTELEKEVNSWLDRDYFWVHREWPYKNVKPRIIAEKFMEEKENKSLKDYKIMCFNGDPKVIQIMSNRTKDGFYINHYDTEWNELDIERKSIKKNTKKIKKPKKLNKMLEISRKLSNNIPFVRVDLYYIKNKVYFGELTFYPVGGYMDFANKKHDYIFGELIKL